MSFQKQLRAARLRAGMTQQAVADALEISKSTYCGYETGKRQPDVAKIKRLAVLLHTSGDVLLETGLEGRPSFSEEEELARLYFSLHPSLRDFARNQLRALADLQSQLY